ncbi:formyltetrahydrofolate deformylase [Hyalangium versicolor]|uniref:formyltetrahydrofolate deformylase n=1 Tax=Hyalangium versicolor TaxID=2861190 RepID=UPI001CCF0A01|nr:formyltetrahydrofolate deformylase [Hyalangium versicolor]
MTTPPRAVLRITCQDRPGLVSEVSGLLFKLGLNIHHADQHLDAEANLFFQRIEFPVPDGWDRVREDLTQALGRLGMQYSLRILTERLRVAVLISKHPHCGLDILDRHRTGELQCEVPVVISNHADLGPEISRRGYTFVHEAIAGNKVDQERRILARLAEERIDLVVLARYMQILTGAFVAAHPNRIINIHHSFLPAFAGAEPYRQAFRKGVKLVGATSHYVTEQLDEGPIIAQGVTRVSHRDTVQDMERKGRDLERVVLAEAVRCHLEDRIIAYGHKTVVFE